MTENSYNYKKQRRRKKIIRRRIICAVLIIAIIAAAVFIVKGCAAKSNNTNNTTSVSSAEPDVPHVVSTATVASTGDILIHAPILSNAYNKSADSYDFTNIFEHITPYFSAYDYMVANLEVTCGSTAAGKYSGYPVFNTPDSIVDALKGSGVDMLLTANNHSYDTGFNGMIRTVQVVKERGLAALGSIAADGEGPFYCVKNINNVKIGMTCYTYSTTSNGRVALNGNIIKKEAEPLINTFDYYNLNAFYADAEATVSAMKAGGAEVIIFYMHWGNEYWYKPSSYQKAMAQKLCDLGVDVIIGGHPHVVQPFETLTSESGHETACIYSTGNAVSNQRKEIMDSDNYSGHTEDGMIFTVTVEKWSTGEIKIKDVNILPTWVNLKTVNGKKVYQIIPLDTSVSDWKQFGLSSTKNAVASYNRTMALVGSGLNAYRTSHGMSAVTEKLK